MQRGPALPRRRLAYQTQDSGQTLAEGLDEYYGANLDRITKPDDLPPESAALFRSHDICHVIFGLDTNLGDEVMADTRTILSCDVGLARYSAYLANPQAKAIFKSLGYAKSIWATLRAVPRICRAMIEAWRTKQRWPWIPPEAFLRRPLGDLRREFGIRLI